MSIDPKNISRNIPFEEALKFVEAETANIKQTPATTNDQIQNTSSKIPDSTPTAIQQQQKPETPKADAPTFTQKALANLAIGSGVVLMGAGAAAGILLAPITLPGGIFIGSLGIGAGKIAKDANLAKNENKSIIAAIIVGTLGTAGMVALGAKLTTIGQEKKADFAAQKAEKREDSSETTKIVDSKAQEAEKREVSPKTAKIVNSDAQEANKAYLGMRIQEYKEQILSGDYTKSEIKEKKKEFKQEIKADKKNEEITKEYAKEARAEIKEFKRDFKIREGSASNQIERLATTGSSNTAELVMSSRLYLFRKLLQEGKASKETIANEFKALEDEKSKQYYTGAKPGESNVSKEFEKKYNEEVDKFEADIMVGRQANAGKIKGLLNENAYEAAKAETPSKLASSEDHPEEGKLSQRIFNFRNALREGTQSTLEVIEREAKIAGELSEHLENGTITKEFAQNALNEIKKFEADLGVGRENLEKVIDSKGPETLSFVQQTAELYKFLANLQIEVIETESQDIRPNAMLEKYENQVNDINSTLADKSIPVAKRYLKLQAIGSNDIERIPLIVNYLQEAIKNDKTEDQTKEIKTSLKKIGNSLDPEKASQVTKEEVAEAYTIIQGYFAQLASPEIKLTESNVEAKKQEDLKEVTDSESPVDRAVNDMMKELEDSETNIMNDYAKAQKNIRKEEILESMKQTDGEIEELEDVLKDLEIDIEKDKILNSLKQTDRKLEKLEDVLRDLENEIRADTAAPSVIKGNLQYLADVRNLMSPDEQKEFQHHFEVMENFIKFDGGPGAPSNQELKAAHEAIEDYLLKGK